MTAAYGHTRCPGCDRTFAATPTLPTTTFDAVIGTSPRQVMAGPGTTETRLTWHTGCLEDFREASAESRRRAETERQAELDELRGALSER